MKQVSLRHFFVFSLLLLFLGNVSGIGVCLEHRQHNKEISNKNKDSRSEKGPVMSKDDQCQCALYLSLNHSLIPESAVLNFPEEIIESRHVPHPEIFAYYCLLDYFSSRAPPASLRSAA